MNLVPQIRPLSIYSADNGYVVAVGCKTLIFSDKVELLQKLEDYLKDPSKVEREMDQLKEAYLMKGASEVYSEALNRLDSLQEADAPAGSVSGGGIRNLLRGR
jgi:hypothetical protein